MEKKLFNQQTAGFMLHHRKTDPFIAPLADAVRTKVKAVELKIASNLTEFVSE
jgi:hypothetical protein